MRNLTLIKNYPSIQLAHLYEHLFLRRVNEFFYEQHLFKQLDYSAHGTTFDQGGIITMDLDFYTKLALKHKNEIERLHIEFGDDNEYILTELNRMSAEEPWRLCITNIERVMDELKKLDAEPWQRIDAFPQLDTTQVRRKTAPVYLVKDRAPKPRPLYISLDLDREFTRDNRALSPLFNIVARLFVLTAVNRITATFGFYGGDLGGKAKPLSVFDSPMIIPRLAGDVDLSVVAHLCQETYDYIFLPATVDRLIVSLQAISYHDDVASAHSFERILNETDILTGSAGWRKISTEENISKILAHTTLTLKFGRQKITVPLQK